MNVTINSKMTADLFKLHVRALVKDPLDIIQSLSPTKVDMSWVHLWHGATGLILELVELFAAVAVHEDQENVNEELGDALFYLEQIEQRMAYIGIFPVKAVGYSNIPDTLDMIDLLVCGGDLCDLIKKYVIYDKELSSVVGDGITLSDALSAALCSFKQMTDLFIQNNSECSIDEIRRLNYTKLKKRYPSGYTDQAASERADKVSTDPQNQAE